MSHRPFTVLWADALRAAIEDDADYRSAAAKWTWPVAMVLEPAAEFGYPEAVAIELALDRGRCAHAEVRDPSTVTAPFVLRATYATWKSIVRGELDVMSAVVHRKVTVRGSLTTLMMHTRAAIALVACAQRVPTEFPDER